MFSLGGLPHLANSSTVQCPLTTFEMKAHHEFSCKASISSCTRKRIENEVIDIHEWEWRHEWKGEQRSHLNLEKTEWHLFF
jgi:hypothetical protein